MAEVEFDKVKKIVRSVLIPCQRGCTLREFLKAYRELNGISFPFSKFGFSSDKDMLESMPDVVIIQYSRNRDMILSAVADESTQHIQSMVSKQKAPKKKPPAPVFNSVQPVFSKRYDIPPRFKNAAPAPVVLQSSPTSKRVAPVGLQKKILKLLSKYPLGLSLSNFMGAFEQVNGQKLSFRNIGFFTLQECLETVPNITMKTKNNEIFVLCKGSEISSETLLTSSMNGVSGNVSYSQVSQSNGHESRMEKIVTKKNQEQPKPLPHHEVDTELKWKNISFTSNGAEASGGKDIVPCQELKEPDDIPQFVLKNLQRLADMYPDGIKATEFPSIYEKVINTEFDLHSLGYNDLSVFIDAVPHIFMRKEILGTKRNWLIVPAGRKICESPNRMALLHDTIISNIRTLLEANPEGISIDDFLHIYSINCTDPLCISAFGFTSLESFLMNNASQVPLTIASSAYGKMVHLVQAPEVINPEPQSKLSGESLSDVVLPGADMPCAELPADLDINKFFLVYVSNVETPSTFYIQLQCYFQQLRRLYDKIEDFYGSSASDLYKMKSKHVKVNTLCVALWPEDNLWYRVIITSIVSLEEVQVFYFDYGTKDTIPITFLRYMKKEFSVLPAQALLSNLACLKPAHNSKFWSQQACSKMLSLCKDVSLMAQIHSISDQGNLSLVLCDTNDESKDIFINDELLNAGLAVSEVSELVNSVSSQELPNWVNPHAANYQTISSSNPLFLPPLGLPVPAPSLPHSPIPAPIPVPSFYNPPISDQFPSNLSGSYEASTSTPADDSEVFVDDDDLFQQFYEDTLSYVMKRYVKRVRTVDAYIFHIISVEGEPFVSCGDISALIWDKRDVNYLMQRLHNREYDLPSMKILQTEHNKDMFYQIGRFFVKGSQEISEEQSQILVCPLSNVIEILNFLGQPSAELRRQILYELENFNPTDPNWMELSEGQIPDMEEVDISSEDDKLNRLCLYDLTAMKESIRLRAERVQNCKTRAPSCKDDIMKMEQLLSRVNKRINEIKEVCKMFNR